MASSGGLWYWMPPYSGQPARSYADTVLALGFTIGGKLPAGCRFFREGGSPGVPLELSTGQGLCGL